MIAFIDILPNSVSLPKIAISLDDTCTRSNMLFAISLDDTKRVLPPLAGYIAGNNDGIVTVAGVSASLRIWVAHADDPHFVWQRNLFSLNNGHYLIDELDPNKKYLIMARDHNGEYEPVVYDNIAPMTDKSVQELRELWQSWQVTN